MVQFEIPLLLQYGTPQKRVHMKIHINESELEEKELSNKINSLKIRVDELLGINDHQRSYIGLETEGQRYK